MSQRPTLRSCDAQEKPRFGSCRCSRDAVRWTSACWAAGTSGPVLGGDRSRGIKRGRAAVRRVSCRALVSGGSARVAGCRLSASRRCLGVICPSPSGRRSRSCSLVVLGCERSRVSWPGAVDDLPRAATELSAPDRPRLSIGPRPRRRMPSVALDDRSRRSSRSTRSCVRYVQDRLAGAVQRPDGSVAGPQISWRWAASADRERTGAGDSAWSPEQISSRLRVDFPDDESMRVSHEAIYQSLYVQGRGALRRELTACLRTGRALRVPRNRTSRGNRSFVTDELLISERPAEVDDRAVPGHWEGDLILGIDRSAIGTLVERSSRFTMLLHLPPIEGHDSPRTNSSPARHGCRRRAPFVTRSLTRSRPSPSSFDGP